MQTTTSFKATSLGFNNGSTWVVGPVLVDVIVTDGDGRFTPSYYVHVDGRHQCGGFAHHIEGDASPVSFLTNLQPLGPTGWQPTN